VQNVQTEIPSSAGDPMPMMNGGNKTAGLAPTVKAEKAPDVPAPTMPEGMPAAGSGNVVPPTINPNP